MRGLESWSCCLTAALLEDTAALLRPSPKQNPSARLHQVQSEHQVDPDQSQQVVEARKAALEKKSEILTISDTKKVASFGKKVSLKK